VPGVFLVRLRIAEIGEDAVAHVFGDEPAEPGQHPCDRLMVGVDDGPQILGVEPRREFGRAGEVAEQDGQLAPLRFGRNGRRGCRRNGRRLLSEGGNRVEHAAAMADQRDAEVPQVIGGQARQYAPIDRIVAERGGILFEAETAQPITDIHRAIVGGFAAPGYSAASAAAQPRNAGS
jgi:hypothetical protein